MDLTQLAFEAAPKALVYAAVVVALGLGATRAFVARAAELAAPLDAIARRLLARRLLVAALTLAVGVAGRLLGHTVAAFGAAEAFTADALWTIGIESQWGAGWQAQGLAALTLALTAMALGSASPGLWLVPCLAALASAATMPRLGHGAESPGAGVLHATHVVGAGLWLGTLIAMLWLERRVRRGYGVTAAATLHRALVTRFSPLAVFTSSVVIVSGVLAVLDYVPTRAAVVDTAYGRTLLVKLLLVGVVGACGFANWQAVLAGRVPSRRLLRLEAATALVIVVVTAVLTELEPPALP